MNFFINASMQPQKSGIEHAQLTRLRLFKQHKTPAKILLRDWDPILHQTLKNDGVDEADVINMFDYFQQATDVPEAPVHAVDIDFGVLNTTMNFEPEQNRYEVYTPQNQIVARINLRKDSDIVLSTELFDGFNNLYRVDLYDIRGFVSMQQWYSPDNKIENEVWLTPSGIPVIHTFNRKDANGDVKRSGWQLTEVGGKVMQFNSVNQLLNRFLNDMNRDFWSDDQPNVMILDRATIADYNLLRLEKPAYTVLHFHSAQASAQDPLHGTLNNNYEFSLNVIDGFDAAITATEKQAKDIEKRFHPAGKLFPIPVGVVPDRLLKAKHVPVAKREFGKMVVLSRIAPEKQLQDLVHALAIARKEFPMVSLDIYGYADSSNNFAARTQLLDAAKEEGMEDVVKLKGYSTDIDKIENNAMMFGLTSVMEGFNLAIMEATAHGLISFTYDVNYGPNEIVVDGKNGRVTPYKDVEAMGQAILEVLRDKQLQQEYSDGAYESAERYSSENVWKQWQLLLDEASKRWQTKLAALPAGAR